MFCPNDKTLLLRNNSGKPLYQCSDCSGVFAMLPSALELGAFPDAPLSPLRCPQDGSQLHIDDTAGVAIHLCHKCRSAWVDGDAQEKLLTKLPDWFGKPRDRTAKTVAGGVVIEALFTIFLG